MKIKFIKIPGIILAVSVIIPTTAVSQTNSFKPESIEYLEKKVLYSKSNVVTNNWFDYKRGMFVANRENKYLLMNFCSSTSSYCLKLEENTFSNPAVKKLLSEKFVTIKVNANANNPMIINNKKVTEKDLIKKYNVAGFPTITFLDSGGRKISGTIKGYLPPEKFIIVLKYISTDAYKSTNFLDFMRIEEKNMIK